MPWSISMAYQIHLYNAGQAKRDTVNCCLICAGDGRAFLGKMEEENKDPLSD